MHPKGHAGIRDVPISANPARSIARSTLNTAETGCAEAQLIGGTTPDGKRNG